MFEAIGLRGVGRSAERRHKELDRRWRDRFFGRRTMLWLWLSYALVLVVVAELHPSQWSLFAGVVIGGVGVSLLLAPDVFRPNHIRNWQLGAWGEQMTAVELKQLAKSGWTVRHDVSWKDKLNHDHVVVGGAAFVVNSKNVRNSRVTVRGSSIRVRSLDNDRKQYPADSWLSSARAEAWDLKCQLGGEAGFPVHVYPVIAVWGALDGGPTWIDDVALVPGEQIVDFIESRPCDLLTSEKRERLAAVVRSLQHA